MPSDRPYMREDYPKEKTSATTWLICAITAAFCLRFAVDSGLFSPATSLSSRFALSVDGLAAGRVWTLFSFWLLHSTSNLFHVGLVLLGLFLVGRELEGIIGMNRLLAVFGSSILTGAACWVAVSWHHGGELIGATAALYGLVAVLASLQPNREVNLLLFFAFPVSFRLKHLAAALLISDTLAFLLIDVLGQSLPFTYAPLTHLGGLLAGWMYFRVFHANEQPLTKMPHTGHREYALAGTTRSADVRSGAATEAPRNSSADFRAQVDRVLDKINSEGFGALTPEERQILEDAKAQLKSR